MAENIEFRLKVIDDKLGIALEQNEKKAKSLGTALSVAVGSFASTAITKGLSLVSDGFRELTSFVSDSVKASAESEEALKKLEVALSQTGLLTKENVDSFKDFATQIQATTAFEDDFVISNIALIQSLTRLDTEGLKRATEAAINLSSALGVDLESASRIIGKAAEGNTVALGKLGIQFQKGANDAETFGNVLSSIESRFGGAAQAQAQTFAGAITQLSNTWGDLKENVGAAITQSPAVIAAFGAIKDTILRLSDALNTSFGSTSQDAVADLFRLLLDGANAVILSFDAIQRVISASIEASLGAIRILALGLTTPVAAVLELLALIPGVGESFRSAADIATNEVLRLSAAYDENIKKLGEAISGETFLTGVSDQIAETRVGFDVLYNEIKDKSQDLKNNKVSIIDEEASDNLKILRAELIAIDNEFYLAKNQIDEENRIAEKERFLVRTSEDIASLQQFELDKSELIYQAAVDRASATLKGEELSATIRKAAQEKELRDLKINQKTKSDTRQQELKDQQAFFSAATSLQSSKSKELIAVGKVAALAELAIKTPQAVGSSFAYGTSIGGPPVGFALATVAAIAMAQQAARIAGVQGFAEGGIIGQGATMGSDNRLATVRDGEMVLNADQQKNLFNMINNGSSVGDIVVQVDGREIARAVRTQLNNGYKLA